MRSSAGSISVIAVTAGGCSAPAGRSLCRPALRRRRGPWVVARLQVGHPRAGDGELVAGGVELPDPGDPELVARGAQLLAGEGQLVLQRDDPGGRLQELAGVLSCLQSS